MGFESLCIDLAGCFLVLVVVTGSIRLKHGSTEVDLCAGQAAAVSVNEFEAEIVDPSYGDCVFVVHLFHRMPKAEKLGRDSLLAALVEKQGRHVPGIFPYTNAGQLRLEASPVGLLPEDAAALLFKMYCCGLESTVRFIASGLGSGASEIPKLRPRGLSLLHLPKPVAGLVW